MERSEKGHRSAGAVPKTPAAMPIDLASLPCVLAAPFVPLVRVWE